MDLEEAQLAKKRLVTAKLAVFVSMVLGVLKLGVAMLAGSAAVAADGIQSLACAIVALAVALALKIGERKADDEFPFGYGKAEYLVSVAAYAGLMGLGLFMAIGAIGLLFSGSNSAPGLISVPVSLISVGANYLMFQLCACAGSAVNSAGLLADAKQNRADMFSSIAVAIGVGLSQLGAAFYFCDALAAFVVSLLIMRDAAKSWWADLGVLMGRQIPAVQAKLVRRLAARVAGIEGIDFVRARRTGPGVWVDIGVRVAPERNISETQEVCGQVRGLLMRKLSWVQDVDVFPFSAR